MSIPQSLVNALLMIADVCPACHGTQTGEWDSNEGRRMPCGHCDGSGRVVTCLNSEGDNAACRKEMPAPEAEEEGCYCASCRKWLDVPEAAE